MPPAVTGPRQQSPEDEDCAHRSTGNYSSFAYSALASFRTGMSGFTASLLGLLQQDDVGIPVPAQDGKALPVRRQAE